jgi:hypothetical protein
VVEHAQGVLVVEPAAEVDLVLEVGPEVEVEEQRNEDVLEELAAAEVESYP